MTDPVDDHYTPVVWALFTKREAAETLPDPEVEAFFEAAEAQIGVDGLLSGWGIVAARLRQMILGHATACDCGSLEWMQREQLHLANREEQSGTTRGRRNHMTTIAPPPALADTWHVGCRQSRRKGD
jgi:hypothetical protein